MYKLDLKFKVFEKYNNNYMMLQTAYTKKRNIRSTYLSGCAMMVNLKDFWKVFGFDERFFMYMEDVDICLRIKKYGTITYFPNAHIYHHFEKGSSKNFKLFFIHVKSYITYLIKHFKFN